MSITYPAARAAACRAVGLDPEVYASRLNGDRPEDFGANAATIAMRSWSPAPDPEDDDDDLWAPLATHATHAAFAAAPADVCQTLVRAGQLIDTVMAGSSDDAPMDGHTQVDLLELGRHAAALVGACETAMRRRRPVANPIF